MYGASTMSDQEANDHSPLCHHVERQLVINQAEVQVAAILDGEEQRIAQIISALNALRDSPEAA